jgi:hypothetical protein
VLVRVYAEDGRRAEAGPLVAEIRAINPELTAEQAALRMGALAERERMIATLRSSGLP